MPAIRMNRTQSRLVPLALGAVGLVGLYLMLQQNQPQAGGNDVPFQRGGRGASNPGELDTGNAAVEQHDPREMFDSAAADRAALAAMQSVKDYDKRELAKKAEDESSARKQREAEENIRREQQEREKEEAQKKARVSVNLEAKKKAETAKAWMSTDLHPQYNKIASQRPYQKMVNQRGEQVNIFLVRTDVNGYQKKMYETYKDELLFIGISSFEDFPLPSVNPFSPKYASDAFVNLFPGFLHMMRDPDNYFDESKTKALLLSQSDFSLPSAPKRDYAVPKKYDFVYSGSDQDVWNDCVGWSSFAKNWSFVVEALEVMCGELDMTGVLIATIAKDGKKRCKIPKSCEGKIVQTRFLNQGEYFAYAKQSRFQFLPQVHDASPRVAAQGMAHDLPLLMNAHISGGWKYVDDTCKTVPCPKTGRVEEQRVGEFFNDIKDFAEQAKKIVKNADVPGYYQPQKYLLEHYGDYNCGKVLIDWVQKHFGHRIKLPEDTTLLLPGSFS